MSRHPAQKGKNMNNVQLLGNLTKDPETRGYGNSSFTLINIAVNDGWGDKKKTYFISTVASGKTGENISKYLSKGDPLLLNGKLYTKKDESTGFDTLRLAVTGFSFIPGVKSSGGGGAAKKEAAPEAPASFDSIPF
jgi:single-strand DNA-binding protein